MISFTRTPYTHERAHTNTCTHHTYACAHTARDSFDPTRSAKTYDGKDMVSSGGAKALGGSGYYPVVGKLKVSRGRHRWAVKADGSNNMWMGLVADDVDVGTRWHNNKRCWGARLGSRGMDFAGQRQERSEGPGSFNVPCEVTVVVDCDAGTMSFAVEGPLELQVVCESLPKNEALRFGCATGNSSCEVEMVAYESL